MTPRPAPPRRPQVTFDDCRDCKVMVGPVDGSLMVRNCKGMSVHAICRQVGGSHRTLRTPRPPRSTPPRSVHIRPAPTHTTPPPPHWPATTARSDPRAPQYRTRDCADTTSCLYTLGPIIESSTRMRFAPWAGGYPKLESQLKAARLSPHVEPNAWGRVHDFNDPDGASASRNWSLLSPSEVDAWSTPVPQRPRGAGPVRGLGASAGVSTWKGCDTSVPIVADDSYGAIESPVPLPAGWADGAASASLTPTRCTPTAAACPPAPAALESALASPPSSTAPRAIRPQLSSPTTSSSTSSADAPSTSPPPPLAAPLAAPRAAPRAAGERRPRPQSAKRGTRTPMTLPPAALESLTAGGAHGGSDPHPAQPQQPSQQQPAAAAQQGGEIGGEIGIASPPQLSPSRSPPRSPPSPRSPQSLVTLPSSLAHKIGRGGVASRPGAFAGNAFGGNAQPPASAFTRRPGVGVAPSAPAPVAKAAGASAGAAAATKPEAAEGGEEDMVEEDVEDMVEEDVDGLDELDVSMPVPAARPRVVARAAPNSVPRPEGQAGPKPGEARGGGAASSSAASTSFDEIGEIGSGEVGDERTGARRGAGEAAGASGGAGEGGAASEGGAARENAHGSSGGGMPPKKAVQHGRRRHLSGSGGDNS